MTNWKAEPAENGLFWQVWADDMELIADEISEDQARLIVAAVINHDETVRLLKEWINGNMSSTLRDTRALLNRIEGKSNHE